MTQTRHDAAPSWYTPQDCNLDDFRSTVEVTTDLADYPHATAVVDGVLIYGPEATRDLSTGDARRSLQSELARALQDGPGVVVFAGAFEAEAVDGASAVFRELVARQHAAGAAGGDHFGKPGANDRVWGALDKLALVDPAAFVSYYSNDVLALVSEAWLGRGYQVTSQVNIVNPGGAAQTAHRDYHLGFMDREQAMAYPAHVHALSPALTLQGAVAHVDMPVASGTTKFLPHSQKYPSGYIAFHDPEFVTYFEERFVQLPLSKGDAVFFNPALFHAAGANQTSDISRMANLLQVSSAFGRAMETVDTTAITIAVFDELVRRRDAGLSAQLLANAAAVAAEGYPFPTNLDSDQPVGALAPPSQLDVLTAALAEGWERSRLENELTAQQTRRQAPIIGGVAPSAR